MSATTIQARCMQRTAAVVQAKLNAEIAQPLGVWLLGKSFHCQMLTAHRPRLSQNPTAQRKQEGCLASGPELLKMPSAVIALALA